MNETIISAPDWPRGWERALRLLNPYRERARNRGEGQEGGRVLSDNYLMMD